MIGLKAALSSALFPSDVHEAQGSLPLRVAFAILTLSIIGLTAVNLLTIPSYIGIWATVLVMLGFTVLILVNRTAKNGGVFHALIVSVWALITYLSIKNGSPPWLYIPAVVATGVILLNAKSSLAYTAAGLSGMLVLNSYFNPLFILKDGIALALVSGIALVLTLSDHILAKSQSKQYDSKAHITDEIKHQILNTAWGCLAVIFIGLLIAEMLFSTGGMLHQNYVWLALLSAMMFGLHNVQSEDRVVQRNIHSVGLVVLMVMSTWDAASSQPVHVLPAVAFLLLTAGVSREYLKPSVTIGAVGIIWAITTNTSISSGEALRIGFVSLLCGILGLTSRHKAALTLKNRSTPNTRYASRQLNRKHIARRIQSQNFAFKTSSVVLVVCGLISLLFVNKEIQSNKAILTNIAEVVSHENEDSLDSVSRAVSHLGSMMGANTEHSAMSQMTLADIAATSAYIYSLTYAPNGTIKHTFPHAFVSDEMQAAFSDRSQQLPAAEFSEAKSLFVDANGDGDIQVFIRQNVRSNTDGRFLGIVEAEIAKERFQSSIALTKLSPLPTEMQLSRLTRYGQERLILSTDGSKVPWVTQEHDVSRSLIVNELPSDQLRVTLRYRHGPLNWVYVSVLGTLSFLIATFAGVVAGFLRYTSERQKDEQNEQLSEIVSYSATLSEEVHRQSRDINAAQHRLKEILDAQKSWVAAFDKDLILEFCNTSFAASLMSRPEDLVGRSITDLLSPASMANEGGAINDARLGHTSTLVIDVQIGDQGLRKIEVNYLPRLSSDGGVDGIYLISNDVTVLTDARDSALESLEIKTQFLANISHEIRTPINGIKGYIQLMQREDLPAEASRCAAEALNACNIMTRLLNDLLDFSKVEAGKMTLEIRPFDLHELMTRTVDLHRTTLASKTAGLSLNINIITGTPQFVAGDSLRLQQVVSNLLSNAIKFTQSGSVTLTVDHSPISSDVVCLLIRVRDTGIGMSREQVARIFQPFEQADASTSRRYGGSGLGLALSQRILQLMQSDGMHVESEPGRGSEFRFLLPMRLPQAVELVSTSETITPSEKKLLGISDTPIEAPIPPSASGSKTGRAVQPDQRPLQGLCILLVEDNRTNIDVASTMLETLGADVIIATDGEDALDVLVTTYQHVDIILMDIHMPRLDGIQATRSIRQHPQWRDIPVLAMTANLLMEEQSAAVEAGMQGVIPKPIEIPDLVSNILAHAKSRETA